MDGRASRESILGWIERRHGLQLTEDDRKGRASSGEEVWRNNTSRARQHLVDKGYLKSMVESGHGFWELTEKGRSGLRPLSDDELNAML
jgi:hypothetical protein